LASLSGKAILALSGSLAAIQPHPKPKGVSLPPMAWAKDSLLSTLLLADGDAEGLAVLPASSDEQAPSNANAVPAIITDCP